MSYETEEERPNVKFTKSSTALSEKAQMEVDQIRGIPWKCATTGVRAPHLGLKHSSAVEQGWGSSCFSLQEGRRGVHAAFRVAEFMSMLLGNRKKSMYLQLLRSFYH